MFTGLVREIGKLQGIQSRSGLTVLDVRAPGVAAEAKVGDSIAVNGICLTVIRIHGAIFRVEAVGETGRLTTLGRWRSGDRVHLEPALRAGDALDGHLVQGHVDGTGKVLRVGRQGAGRLVTIAAGPKLTRFLTPKGSVAVDGVSLTVDEGPFVDRFSVNLIPHTLGETNFNRLRTGSPVNLEMDVLVKAARTRAAGAEGSGWNGKNQERIGPATGLTLERLLARGFKRFSGGRRS
jgi:riboflavin synthase